MNEATRKGRLAELEIIHVQVGITGIKIIEMAERDESFKEIEDKMMEVHDLVCEKIKEYGGNAHL